MRTRNPEKAVAIVALGIELPEADSPDQFWNNIISKKTAFRKATTEDFGADPSIFHENSETPLPDKCQSLIGAWKKGERPTLNKLPHNFNPQECSLSLLYWLKAAEKALADTSLEGHLNKGLGVIAGHTILPTRAMSEASISFYGREATRNWDINPFAPPPHTNPFREVGYSARLLSETLGFAGPAYTVDAACASSLYAVHLACRELISGRLTAVISGGLAKADPLFTQMGFSQLRALSRSGLSRPYSKEADGLVVGTGAVALVLKRLDRAILDNDHILALILGLGLSNDKKGNLLAPDSEGQVRAMKNAWQAAGLSKDSGRYLELIEGHGTATTLGDEIEISAILEFLAELEAPLNPVTLGSVKSNVGHLLSAAGAVSLAKTALALKHKILPPTAGLSTTDLVISKKPGLRVLGQDRPWPEVSQGQARLAAVNAFGFGGVNAQAILEEYRPELWTLTKSPKTIKEINLVPSRPLSATLIAARTVLAPWPGYEHLARYWLTPEEPPLAQTRKMGGLKATGFFFDKLSLNASFFHLPPKELSEALPQQTLALKAGLAALNAAGLKPGQWPDNLDRNRVGIFMGANIDPRAADYALRWLAPPRAARALIDQGLLDPKDEKAFIADMIKGSPPALTHSRVLGALGSFVASRLSRYLASGGPSFTLSEEKDSGFRALAEAMNFLLDGSIDIALVGVVDTFGDPKTAALAPRTVWVEGAAAMVLASEAGAKILAPLANLTITDRNTSLGPLSGLFEINRNSFYLRHHIKPLGRGRGFCYWLKKPDSQTCRQLEGPGYLLTESPGHLPQALTVPADPIKPDIWLFITGQDPQSLRKNLSDLAVLTEAGPDLDLPLLSIEFWESQAHLDLAPGMAILARDSRELAFLIKRALTGEEDKDPKPRILSATVPLSGDTAWVFPGSGNHYKGLGRGLAMAFPRVMSQLESESADPLGLFQSELFWEPNHRHPSTREAILAQVTFGLLGARVLTRLALHPQAVLGYSLGETTALIATGIWPDRDELYQDLLKTSLFDGDLTPDYLAPREYLHWPAHKPLRWATGLLPRPEAEVRKALETLPSPHKTRVFILIVNTRDEVVAGGEEAALAALAAALDAPIFPIEDVSAVHSPVMSPVLDRYRLFHTRKTVEIPNLKLYSTYLAKTYRPTPEATAESLTNQALYGHCFPDLIETAYADGVRFFLEVGPGNTTTRMIHSILGDKPHLAQSIATTAVDEGWAGLSRLIAELWLSGYPLDPQRYLPQPREPKADARFEVDLEFGPPRINWPDHHQYLTQKKHPEENLEPPKSDDFLSWLSSQTNKDQAKSTGPSVPEPLKSPAITKKDTAETKVIKHPVIQKDGATEREIATKRLSGGKIPTGQSLPDENTLAKSLLAKNLSNDPLLNTALPNSLLKEQDQTGQGKKPAHVTDPKTEKEVLFNREDCLNFAVGSIAQVLGEDFAEVDSFPSRVRLPDNPLMFVDRVLTLEGAPKSLKSGRMVTEHDIREKAWYLEAGRISPGMSIESGQADLFLSAYLGADFSNRGLAHYRLLDAEVTFHRELPKSGETASYDIRINRFFQHADTQMFRFEFDGSISGQPLMTMRQGCAGFFSQKALNEGRGLIIDTLPAKKGFQNPQVIINDILPNSLSSMDLDLIRSGKAGPLGPNFENLPIRPLLLPDGPLALLDRVTKMELMGGIFGAGFIRAEADINPQAWFLKSHFKGDEVMPGTLMYDASLQTLRIFLLSLGWLGKKTRVSFQPPLEVPVSLKCRGQVTPKTKSVAYEVHVRELDLKETVPVSETKRRILNGKKTYEPYALADCIMFADGRPIVEVHNLGLRLAGCDLEDLQKTWTGKKPKHFTVKFHTLKKNSNKLTSPVNQEPEPLQAVPEKNEEKSGLLTTVIRRPGRRKEFFNQAKIRAISEGKMSEAFGESYARFDDGSFVARLPKRPYAFIHEATILEGRAEVVKAGTMVEARYIPDPSLWIFNEAGGQKVLPYAALCEIALQPCGFLASYMGSALPFPWPMHFRNLGGQAKVHGHISSENIATIVTTATLTKSSVLGATTIQHYSFTTRMMGEIIYEGQTNFGYLSPENLARQFGLKVDPQLATSLAPMLAKPFPYPKGLAWPSGHWLMLDELSVENIPGKKPSRIWGRVKVNPQAWFFEAHFPGDPVWPGSLGLEAFIQAAKVLAKNIFEPDTPFEDLTASWEAPELGTEHKWLYRGQIIPSNREVNLGLEVTKINRERKTLTYRGLLWVDNLVVYQVDDFTVRLN